jgi:hypothetical protein
MKFEIYSSDSTTIAHYIRRNNFTSSELMSVDTETHAQLCLYQPLLGGLAHLFYVSLRTEHVVTATATPVSGNVNKYKKNSVALVHKRTIPTERLPLVGEVSANFRAAP